MNIQQKSRRIQNRLNQHNITDYTLTTEPITLCGRDYGAHKITLTLPSHQKYLARLALNHEYIDMYGDTAGRTTFIYDSRLDPS